MGIWFIVCEKVILAWEKQAWEKQPWEKQQSSVKRGEKAHVGEQQELAHLIKCGSSESEEV